MQISRRTFILICGWLSVMASHTSATEPTTAPATRPAFLSGIDQVSIPQLTHVLGLQNFSLQRDEESASGSNALIIVQLGRDLSDAAATAFGEHVRRGGSLLLVIPNRPSFAPMRLAFMLPTTAWKSYQARGIDGQIEAAEFDPAFFGNVAPATLSLPYHIDLRAFHAVERGQARYERFAHNVQGDEYIRQPQKPGDTFWTRPLLNRDWTIRIRGGNQAADGLLVTGRYGAGRVAVFGAGPEQLEQWASQSPATISSILDWLGDSIAQPIDAGARLEVYHSIDTLNRLVKVKITNFSSTSVNAEVIARLLTSEGALVCDVSKLTELPAGESRDVTIEIPPATASGYQAQSVADCWDVRLGVLTRGGAVVAHEVRFPVDLRPDPLLTISLDDLYAIKYPFDAPRPDTMPHFQARMGSGTTRYTYKPGEKINATVTVANGVRNIAPQARVIDLNRRNNPSVNAITDGHTKGDQAPTMTLQASGTWSGMEKQDNAIEFTWPEPRTICGVTLVGAADDYRKFLRRNPTSAVIEIDGKEVARAEGLDQRFPAEMGRPQMNFAPVKGQRLTLRLPSSRSAPVLAEVEVYGTAAGTEPQPTLEGRLQWNLIDVETGEAIVKPDPVAIHIGAAERATVSSHFIAPRVHGPHAYRIEAMLDGRTASAPVLVTDPVHPLHDITDLNPPGGLSFGFIVTRGFRNFFQFGTGTEEMPDAWKSPDDLIWCYARLLKQEGVKATTKANRLYVTSNDFKHYSTPWRTFPNGESVMQLGAVNMAAAASTKPGWAEAKTVRYEFSDRWDTGPSIDLLHSWQDYTEFDLHLRQTTGKGLQGQTRQELAKEMHEQHEGEWMAYQKAAYVKALKDLAAPFEAAGKKVVVSAQGVPLVSGSDAEFVYRTVRGMSDDSTWGMTDENVPLTTGRQMGTLAFNPSAAMSTLFMWGWDSAILNNPFWRVPVGTTESSRRHQYDRAWRGTIGWDGSYQSIHTYGYNANGGTSYQMLGNDWQELWRAQERLSLLPPEAPIGVGLVISTAKVNDPKTVSFNGAGGDSKSAANEILDRVPNVVRRLQEAGVSVPFAANALALKHWNGNSPLVLLNVHEFSDDEFAAVKLIRDRGVKLYALISPDDQSRCSTSAKELLRSATVLPVDASSLTAVQADELYATMRTAGDLTITFAPGTGGYGCMSGGAMFVVVEDWREQGRSLQLRVRRTTDAPSATAVNLNEHVALPIRPDGRDWVVDVPTRPGDGTFVMIRESGR
jgi:hypothetical protein